MPNLYANLIAWQSPGSKSINECRPVSSLLYLTHDTLNFLIKGQLLNSLQQGLPPSHLSRESLLHNGAMVEKPVHLRIHSSHVQENHRDALPYSLPIAKSTVLFLSCHTLDRWRIA